MTFENLAFGSGISSLYYIRPILIHSIVQNLSNQNLSSTLENVISMIEDPIKRYGLTLSDYNYFMDGLLGLSDMGLLSFCFGNIMNFTLTSQIESILLLNETQSSLRYKFDEYYYFRIRVYSFNKQPLVKAVVNLEFNLVHFPSYLFSDYLLKTLVDFKNMIIDFSQMSNITDENGEILNRYV